MIPLIWLPGEDESIWAENRSMVSPGCEGGEELAAKERPFGEGWKSSLSCL